MDRCDAIASIGRRFVTGRRTVLVIAGSDSSGGAGVARDLATLAASGVEAKVTITAVTAQTDEAVLAIHHVPPDIVRDQIRAALDGRGVAAIKIGMLGCRPTVEAVASGLEAAAGIPVVLDPVLVSSSGGELLDAAGRAAMYECLFPHVTLLTPNIPEAAVITGQPESETWADIEHQARAILRLGPRAVLVKGGHGGSRRSVDLLVERSQPVRRFDAARLSRSMRGTGCILSTRIAACLASGASISGCCAIAKDYLWTVMQQTGE